VQKNKSAKVKQHVAQVQAQAAMAGKSKDQLAKEKEKYGLLPTPSCHQSIDRFI
jgi:hypothetical protein